jgi:hypothetical protein
VAASRWRHFRNSKKARFFALFCWAIDLPQILPILEDYLRGMSAR